MFYAILSILPFFNLLLFAVTNSPIFWYAALCTFVLMIVLVFVDAELQRITTKIIVLLLLLGAAWHAYVYGRHIAGVDWEILITQSVLLALAIGYDSLPFRKQESQAI